MRKIIVSLSLIILTALCHAQPSYYATLYCVNPSGNIIPLLQAGTPSPTNPPGVLAYGMNISNQAVPIQCDASGNFIPSFDGIPFVNIPTPTPSEVICYDGVQYTPCPPTAGAAQILYLTNTASDISTYNLWDTVPLGAQFTVAATIPATNVKTLIKAFATTSGYPNITVIPAGEWQADTYAQISSAANTTTMQIDIYKYPVGGPASLLFSFADIPVTTANLTHYTVESVQSAITLAATDRIVVMYSMTHNTGSSLTGTVYGGGSTNYSHVHTPIGTISTGGATKVCSTAITAITVTNGIVTSITCP